MPVDREHIKNLSFTKQYQPHFSCPTCQRGTLHLLQESLFEGADYSTHKNLNHPDWETEFWTGRFSSLFCCSTTNCKETVVITGEVGCDFDNSTGYFSVYKPNHFDPPIHVIPISKVCPNDVADEIVRAFNLLWTDLPAGMNHLRNAVENIMTHLKIPRSTKNSKGKIERISLHGRIQRYRQKNAVLADRLEAIKWLGNAGSHGDVVSFDSFCDACDLLEDFIRAHFEKQTNKIEKLTKRIIKRKGR